MTAWVLTVLATGAAGMAWLRLRARLELVARAAHELRTPLCSARLAVHAAGREAGWSVLAPVDRELERAALALADLSAARGGRRIHDRLQRLDAADVLAEAASAWTPMAWPVGVEVRVERSAAGLAVQGDRLRLLQAVGNLVGNALEHGAGPITLRARAAGAAVRLEVADRGPGLPAPLAELTRRPRAGRGARGRGLAIATDIAARHGGRLVTAPAASGTCLALELPSADAQRGPARRRAGGEGRGG